MKPYRLSATARHDLRSIADFIHNQRPASAVEVILAIRSNLEFLSSCPHAGRSIQGRRSSYRIFPAKRPADQYLIAYQSAPDRLIILTIVHGARDWLSLIDDLGEHPQ